MMPEYEPQAVHTYARKEPVDPEDWPGEGHEFHEHLYGMVVTLSPDDVRYTEDGFWSPISWKPAPDALRVSDWIADNRELVAAWVEDLSDRIHEAVRVEARQSALYARECAAWPR